MQRSTNCERVLTLARHANWLKLNEDELRQLTGYHADDAADWPGSLLSASEALSERAGGARICVTCGERGAFVWDAGLVVTAAAPRVRVRDTVGAGDAFTAAFVHGLLTVGEDFPRILKRACALGALIASLPGGQPDYDAPH